MASTRQLLAWDEQPAHQMAQRTAELGDSARAVLIGGAVLALALAAGQGWWHAQSLSQQADRLSGRVAQFRTPARSA